MGTRYYRGSGTTVSASGTTVYLCGTTAWQSGTTACLAEDQYRSHRIATTKERPVGPPEKQGKEMEEKDVYVLILPKPFRRGPPLNSTAFLLLNATYREQKENTVLHIIRGANNRLVPKGDIPV